MFKRLLIILLLLCSPISALAGADNKTQLTPKEGAHQFPFFDYLTPVWSYNGQVPGPTLRARAGTTLVVDVNNQLKEATSVHWHGLRIDNAMDGVPGVTQEPIKPGERFTYRLRLEEAGTFWYHPHLNAGEQLERGLKGVLIVEEQEKLPFSQDVVWLLDDWRLRKDGTIYPYFNTRLDLMHDGRWGNAITINGKVKPTLTVTPGERIRLRIINGANARIFAGSLAGLPMQVIAVDGRPVSTFFPFDHFILSPGNRVDLDITIPDDAGGRIFQFEDRFTRRPHVLGKIKVRDEKPHKTPQFAPPKAKGFIPAEIFEELPVTKTWDLNAVRGGRFGIGWAMNRRLWPTADKADFKLGKPVKIRFINSSSRLHPMHIHGAFFRVLEVNGQPDVELFTRDTVLVGPRESIVIGLIPEHEGIWVAHCHIQSHADAGMMTSIKVDKK